MNLSFQKVFYVVASLIGIVAFMILAHTILIPLTFAMLTAFILFPVVKKLDSWGLNEIVSAGLALLGTFTIAIGSIYLFSTQIVKLSENLTDFKTKILDVFAEITLFFNKNFQFLPDLEKDGIVDGIKTWLNDSWGSLISQTASSTASVLFGLVTAVIFTFLILIYRQGIVRALVCFYAPEHRQEAHKMFKSVQQVGQKYLAGMLIIVIVLGFVNSIGLWIIGIDNPFMFGFFAAILAIIPYAGTFIGAAIPILYAFVSHDSIWMPFTILIFFWFVQLVESNFLTPKIVGGSLKINALASLASIIIGASIWGVSGMILFLPLAAMLKSVCQRYIQLQPFALLIGQKNYSNIDEKDLFIELWNKKIKPKF